MGRLFPRTFKEMGSGSGLWPPDSAMARALDRHAAIRARDFSPKMLAGTAPTSVAEVLQRNQLARADQGSYVVFNGPRNDQPGGWGPRARFGLLDDGATFGNQRWDENGTMQIGVYV